MAARLFLFLEFFFFFLEKQWPPTWWIKPNQDPCKLELCIMHNGHKPLFIIFFFFEIFCDFCFFEKQWPPTWWIKPNQDPCKLELCIQSISRVRHFQIYTIFKSFKHVFKVTCWLIKLQNKRCLAYVIRSSQLIILFHMFFSK